MEILQTAATGSILLIAVIVTSFWTSHAHSYKGKKNSLSKRVAAWKPCPSTVSHASCLKLIVPAVPNLIR